VKATSKFDEENKLHIDDGDMIIVIDGRWVVASNLHSSEESLCTKWWLLVVSFYS